MALGSLIRLSSPIVVFASTALASTLASAISLPMTISAETGIASVYAYSGELTANGETASPDSLTAAHRSLPFGTLVRVTNDVTGDWVVVRINDRGPFIDGRIIDLTPAGAQAIGSDGLAHVSLDILGWSGR
jgi:rare lipoprotein A